MFGRLEYQFLSVQHEPEPASLWNQPLGQHRRILNLNILPGIQQVMAAELFELSVQTTDLLNLSTGEESWVLSVMLK